MKVMICLDDNNGLLFNNRRQSFDCKVHRDMVEYAGDNQIWMRSYSYKSLSLTAENCHVADNYLSQAGNTDFCFIEENLEQSILLRASEIVIYRWNRTYPADVRFSKDILSDFQLVESVNFPGYSHKLITREVYRK